MKLKRLGIEWGAAYHEAQPVQVTSRNGDTFVMFEREGFGIDIVCQTGQRAEVSFCTDTRDEKTKLSIRLLG